MGSSSRPAAAAEPNPSRVTPVVKAVRKVQGCVVNITSEKRAGSNARWPFSPEESQRRVNGMGSGVIVDERGYILTNHHVVDRVQNLDVHLADGSNYPARVITSDREMDLAMIKIDAGRPLQAVAIGSSEDLMVGETVITIGNAFGYENTVSVGIISALKRNVTLADDQVYRNLIQTDACINPGNSGGPLINIEGELIGINVATRSGAQGIGFALPIDDVKRVAMEMLNTRRLAGTWHGIIAAERLQDAVRRVIVNDIQTGSPASEAGLLPGDQVIKVGDVSVTTPLDIERGLLDLRPTQSTKMVVFRDGKSKELPIGVKLFQRVTPEAATDSVMKLIGVKVVPVSAEYTTAASEQLHGGLYVQAVVPGSAADRAMIKPGDILVGMNVGNRHLETIRPDNVIYILRQPELAETQSLPFYIVRSNNIHQGTMSLAEIPMETLVR
ncbi:MAG: trypsin-like peptidase domain-containing protein [Isosphaeraceae bacterium]|nr:trypsin-like peptidase domain-containing protein [Isosphaeraceae bacterium]